MNKYLILYLTEDDRRFAEAVKAEIQSKKEIRCEVRNCSYLGFLEGYKAVIIASFNDKYKIERQISANYPNWPKIKTTHKNDNYPFSSYQKYHYGKTYDDYIEFISSRYASQIL